MSADLQLVPVTKEVFQCVIGEKRFKSLLCEGVIATSNRASGEHIVVSRRFTSSVLRNQAESGASSANSYQREVRRCMTEVMKHKEGVQKEHYSVPTQVLLTSAKNRIVSMRTMDPDQQPYISSLVSKYGSSQEICMPYSHNEYAHTI